MADGMAGCDGMGGDGGAVRRQNGPALRFRWLFGMC